MKKIFCFGLFIIFLGVITANSQTDFLGQRKMESPTEFTDNNYKKIKVVFRHHGSGNCVCPNCACPGCKCPVGICFCGGSSAPQSLRNDEGLTQQDIANGFGIAWVKIEGQQLHMVFETPNDDNGILPVDTSPYANTTDASKFGITQAFYIANNNYTVIKTKYTYGEVVLSITYL